MRIAVCDDEIYFRDLICTEIGAFYQSLDVLCLAFESGAALIGAFEKGGRFDAVFLDIEMPPPDGMQTARRLHEFMPELPVVFLTSHTELAMDGYEVGAFRFLQKPLVREKLAQTLEDLRRLYSVKNTICIRENGEEHYLSPEEILFAEADNNTVRFVTAKRVYQTRMKLSEAAAMLGELSFCRIHRSVIVGLPHIVSRSEKEVRLDSGAVLPVSRSCTNELKKRLMAYVRRNAR